MLEQLLLSFLLIGSIYAPDPSDYVYARSDSEGFIDFRFMGIHRPNQLLNIERYPLKHCCCGHMLAGKVKGGLSVRLNVINIQNVDFSNNNITRIDDTTFLKWNSTTKLRLNYNGMKEISERGFSMLCLRLLSLKGNKLTSVKFDLTCSYLVLQLLDLSYNYLRDMNVLYAAPIMKLDFSGNIINNVEMLKVFYSENLHLENNKITDLFLEKSWGLRENSNLFLDHNSIRRLEGHVSHMNLNNLSISYNKLYEISEEFFFEAFTLVSVNLSRNLLTKIPRTMLSNLNDLRTIDLTANKITKIDVYAFNRILSLREFLIAENPTLKISDILLMQSPVLERIEISGVTDEPDYFRTLKTLKYLRWFHPDFASLRIISNFAHRLQHLELHSVDIQDIVQLMNTYNISMLNTLVLNYVRLNEVPTKMINTSTCLRILSLPNNHLRSLNMSTMPATLRILNLSNNFIDRMHVPTANHLLSLRILDLQSNLLTSVPTYILKEDTKLDFTNLKHNPMENVTSHIRSRKMKTEYLCYDNECVYTNAVFTQRQPNLITRNILGCKCHNSISNIEDYSKRDIYLGQKSVISHLFRYSVLGCIKHASIYNGTDWFDLNFLTAVSSYLTSLYLHGWNLSKIENFELECSPQVDRLSIVKSGLTSINANAFSSFPQLQYLDLSQNQLKTFELDSLRHTPKVTTLNMSHNQLTNVEATKMDDPMEIIQLIHFDLSHNNLQYVDFAPFSLLSNLRTLDFSSNEIVDLCCSNISSQHLCQNFGLNKLSLADNRIAEWSLSTGWTLPDISKLNLKEIDMIIYAGKQFDSICHLNLSGNLLVDFEQQGCRQGGFVLDISKNRILKLSHVILKYNPRILNASWNKIDIIYREEMRNKRTLKELYLAHNLINTLQDGCFNGMMQLKILDLEYNRLKMADARKMFKHESMNEHWKRYLLDEFLLQGNNEMTTISIAVNMSVNIRPKLTLSNVCIILTHGCRLTGNAIKRYLQTPKEQRQNSTRRNMPAYISSRYFECSDEDIPYLSITCV